MKKLGPKVSRVLENKDPNFQTVVFQPLRPPLESEWNLVQDISNGALARFVLATSSSGFFQLGPIEVRPPDGTSMWKHVIKFRNPLAAIAGKLFHVGGGTNQFQTGALENIWKSLSNDEGEVVVILGDAPASGSRDDLVWIECWEQVIGTQDLVSKFGFQQYAGTPLQNDMTDPNVGRETSIRTQWKYRIRVSEGVDLITFREGLGHPSVLAQGGKISPVSGYTFTKTENGHYIAGANTDTAATALNTVDGFVYALPICSIHRKNKTVYSISNPNGAGNDIEDQTSDRFDGAFNDEIRTEDIEDLRHLVALGDDLDALCRETLEEILSGRQDRLGLGDVPDLFSAVNTQIDGISVDARSFINGSLLRRPNNIQRSWSDREITQRKAHFIISGSLNGLGKLVLAPPQFYSSFDTDNYKAINPFIGAVNPPRIINADTGADITPAPGVGINGWENLGDRLTKGTVTFKPNINADVTGKKILIEYDLVIPAGTGLSRVARNFYNIHDDFNNVDVIHTEGEVIEEELSRVINGFTDSQITRPVSHFIEPTGQNELYRAGVIERVYHVFGNGTQTLTIPATIDGLGVLNILRVQLASSEADIPLGFGSNPKLKRNSDGSFTINFTSFFPTITDTIRVTLTLQGKACEVVKENKSIDKFSRTTYLLFQSTGANTYIINTVDSSDNSMDFAYAMAGFFNGSFWRSVCYVSGTQNGDGDYTEITSISGFNTGRIVVNFNVPPVSGRWIRIPVIGTYAPTLTDLYTITYDYVPYQGLSSLITTDETLEAEIVYLSDKALVTTNGTAAQNSISNGTRAGATRLPINVTDFDYNFSGENVLVPGQQGKANTRQLPYDFSFVGHQAASLKMGDLLTIKKLQSGEAHDTNRGCALDEPKISYQINDLALDLTEDVSLQADGTNRTFKTKWPILGQAGTFAVAGWVEQTGLIVLSTGSNVVQGLNTVFLRQLKGGMFIRPAGGSVWYEIKFVESDVKMYLKDTWTLPAFSGNWELWLPDMQVFLNGTEVAKQDIQQVCGRDGIFVLDTAPTSADRVVIKYRTGVNTLNCIYGLAVGKGILDGELLLFTLTTTTNCEYVAAPEFNLLKVGKANQLILNNTVEITSTSGEKNEANRVVIAADFFFPKVRRLKLNQKVTGE